MQIVIDIDEKDKEDFVKRGLQKGVIAQAIENGTILPKGHGDLIDRNKLKGVINKFEYYDQVLDAPTIIEADKESD